MKKFIFTLSIILVLVCNSTAQVLDRTNPPKLGTPPKLNLPLPEKFSLSNGIEVTLIEKHQVPLVNINIVVNVGAVYEDENNAGIFDFTADLLDEGAAGKNALQIADEIDYLGATINTYSGYHESGIYINTPLSKLEQTLQISSEILLKPDFPESEFKRLKNERLGTMMQFFDEPRRIASVGFNKLLWGFNHPYGRPLIGLEKSVKNFDRNSVKMIYDKYFKSNNAQIIVAGDIKKKELKDILEKYFAGWEKGKFSESRVAIPEVNKKTIINIIDKPGSAQSVIFIGTIGVKRNTPDYTAISVMNTILGGSFTSRLNDNLREKHGYTYGASSFFSFRKETGVFAATSSVQTEVTDSALFQFFYELNSIKKPLSDEELQKGKNYLALSYPSNFSTVADIQNQLTNMVINNLPNNYFNTFVTDVLNVSKNDVKKVAEKYIKTDNMIVVIVGDKEKILESIKKLNLGDVKTFTITEMFGQVPKLIE
ncbi:MAG TPA: pitrilysin family protein [Melioribacteraceae bacterium]|nr:pitrilysin family protein [Melioribacteraceae bacterium]